MMRFMLALTGAVCAVVVALVFVATRSVSNTPAVGNPPVHAPTPPRLERCTEVRDEHDLDAQRRPMETALYRLIINAAPRVDTTEPLIIEDVALPIFGAPTDRQMEGWSADAIALARASPPPDCSRLVAAQFPAGARLVPAAAFPTRPADLSSVFPGARQWFAFSRARVDADGDDALVVYERRCDACGIGERVWFHRDARIAWRIAGRAWIWIN